MLIEVAYGFLIARQAQALALARLTVKHPPRSPAEAELTLMRRMGIEASYQWLRTRGRRRDLPVSRHPLASVTIDLPGHAGVKDTSCILMRCGGVYRTVVLDRLGRRTVA